MDQLEFFRAWPTNDNGRDFTARSGFACAKDAKGAESNSTFRYARLRNHFNNKFNQNRPIPRKPFGPRVALGDLGVLRPVLRPGGEESSLFKAD